MNRDDAIFEAQLAALIRVVAAVFAVAGLVPGGPVLSSLPVGIRRQILRMLRPAESALRRLIDIRARGLVVALGLKRAAPTRPIPKGNGSADHVPPFALFDPRKSFPELTKKRPKRGPDPWISGFDEPRRAVPAAPERTPEADINPAGLCRRLQALFKAMNDITGQAKRLARLRARRRAAGEPTKRTEPMRPGWPPGHRKKRTHEIDVILYECHVLASRRTKPPDKPAS